MQEGSLHQFLKGWTHSLSFSNKDVLSMRCIMPSIL